MIYELVEFKNEILKDNRQETTSSKKAIHFAQLESK